MLPIQAGVSKLHPPYPPADLEFEVNATDKTDWQTCVHSVCLSKLLFTEMQCLSLGGDLQESAEDVCFGNR